MNNQIQILDNSDNGWEKIWRNNIVLLFQTIMTKYPIMYDVEEKVSYEPLIQTEIDSSVTPISALFSWWFLVLPILAEL